MKSPRNTIISYLCDPLPPDDEMMAALAEPALPLRRPPAAVFRCCHSGLMRLHLQELRSVPRHSRGQFGRDGEGAQHAGH